MKSSNKLLLTNLLINKKILFIAPNFFKNLNIKDI